MKVKAITTGFYGKGKAVRRIRHGAEFDIPDDEKPAKWMEVIDRPSAEKPAKAKPSAEKQEVEAK